MSEAQVCGESDYIRNLQRKPFDLFRFGAKMQSSQVAEVLIKRGTNLQHTFDSLSQLLAEERISEFPPTWDTVDIYNGILLKAVLAVDNSQVLKRCWELSLFCLDHLPDYRIPDLLLRVNRHLARLCNTSLDESEILSDRNRIPESIIQVEVDLLKPDEICDLTMEKVATWWRYFNRSFTIFGLEPFDLNVTEKPLTPHFTMIRAPEVGPAVESLEFDAPTVTVIVPTWNPSQGFVNTIESLVRQSWKKLEILIVDDASEQGLENIQTAIRMSDNIRLITLSHNSGAYAARNIGIREALGEYVTVCDADDLAHPRRIERQLMPLLENESLVATISQAKRVTTTIDTTYFGYHFVSENASSLLFNKALTIEKVGYYDEVRAAADNEYIFRLKSLLGYDRIKRIEDVLSVVQLSSQSLSRSDFRLLWRADRRAFYRHQYQLWHKEIQQNKSDPPSFMFNPDYDGDRAFSAPASIIGKPNEVPQVVLLLQRMDEVTQDDLVTVEKLSEVSQGPVGLLFGVRLSSDSARTRKELNRPLGQLVESGKVQLIEWRERQTIKNLWVTDPEILLALPDAEEIGFNVDKIIVFCEHGIWGRQGRIGVLDPSYIDSILLRVFSVAPDWLPATKRMRLELGQLETFSEQERLLPVGRIRSLPVLQSKNKEETHAFPGCLRVGVLLHRPMVGRSYPFRILKRALPLDPAIEVVFFEGKKHLRDKTLSRFPSHWSVSESSYEMDDGQKDLIDVLLVDPFNRGVGFAEKYCWKAIARGSILMLPADYKKEFGQAAVYYREGRSKKKIRKLAENLDYREEVKRKQQRKLKSVFSERRFSSHVRKLLGEPQ